MLPNPAHNDPSELPIPLTAIRATTCTNCGHEHKIDDLITYTRLHDGTVLWWHRRKDQDDCDPCKIGSQVCKLCGQELEKKRVHSNGQGFVCLKCTRVQQTDYRKNYREEALKSGDTKKIYYLKNRAKILKQKREKRKSLREQRPA